MSSTSRAGRRGQAAARPPSVAPSTIFLLAPPRPPIRTSVRPSGDPTDPPVEEFASSFHVTASGRRANNGLVSVRNFSPAGRGRLSSAAAAALLIETDRRPAVVLVCRHLKLLKEGREEGTDATYQLIPLDVPSFSLSLSPSSASVRSAAYPVRARFAPRPSFVRRPVAHSLARTQGTRSTA